jgi:Gas vesicle protein G
MGLITGILTLPLAPVRGVAWVTEKVAEQAELELYDEGRILRELIELEEARDNGVLSNERFESAVDQLLERLQVGRELREGRY